VNPTDKTACSLKCVGLPLPFLLSGFHHNVAIPHHLCRRNPQKPVVVVLATAQNISLSSFIWSEATCNVLPVDCTRDKTTTLSSQRSDLLVNKLKGVTPLLHGRHHHLFVCPSVATHELEHCIASPPCTAQTPSLSTSQRACPRLGEHCPGKPSPP